MCLPLATRGVLKYREAAHDLSGPSEMHLCFFAKPEGTSGPEVF